MNDGGWRVSDSDREAAVEALGEHYATGRLDKVEYDERSARAWSARTNLELAPLFADLPAPSGPVVIPPQVPPAPSYGARTTQDRWQRRGSRGRFPRRFPVIALVLVLIVVLHAPWLLFLGLGAWCFSWSRRRARS